MALVDIHLMEGVFDADQKARMVASVTDAVVASAGEATRGVTWVRVHELSDGDWSIGGRPVRAADLKSLSNGAQPNV